MSETKRTKKAGRVLLRIGVILAAAIAAILLGGRLWFRLPVANYYKHSEKAFLIPGLGEKFVPQGLSYDAASGSFFVTGYRSGEGASPIYLVDKKSGKTVKEVLLLEEDGSDFCGHAGGLSVYGPYVYVAGGGDHCLFVYSKDEILQAEDGAGVVCLGSFPVSIYEEGDMSVSFTAVGDGTLWAGEFYREQNYKTADSHKRTTKAGDYQQAMAVAYRFSDAADAVFGLDPVPVKAYSLPDLVQGMCFDRGKVYLSTSYAVAFSHIFVYDLAKAEAQGEIDGEKGKLPLYALDSAALVDDLTFPPMAEEIEILDGRIYTMCESASSKYIFGKLTGGKWCYATKLH